MKLLVTGGTHGMGLGVARALAAQGSGTAHQVVITTRSVERGEATVAAIRSLTGNRDVSFVPCDFTRLRDVRAALGELQRRHQTLDGIFVNAGLGYAARRVETEDRMDAHFQVNHVAQFMLTLGLLDLLARSDSGGRVVFNVTRGGSIDCNDLQLTRGWSYRRAIQQAMVAKRLFYRRLHALYRQVPTSRTSFYGFEIPKTVWSNQINLIPWPMRAAATVSKWLGGFISIDECGAIIAPLLAEDQPTALQRSGKLLSFDQQAYVDLPEDPLVLDPNLQNQLWDLSVALCHDERTTRIAGRLGLRAERAA